MDPALLTSDAFWSDSRPAGARELPDIPELAGHVVFETSGSSGTPKGVAQSKDALLHSAAAVNRHLAVNAGSRWGLALPTHHVGGFGVAARAFQAGVPLIDLRGKWDAGDFTRKVFAGGVTHTTLVPTQVHDLVKAGLRAPEMLEAIVVGGGRMDVATGQAARDLGWPVLASYGMTETASQVATQGLELLGMPYHTAPIPLLPEWDARLSPDGLLEVAGKALFSGYLSDGRFLPRRDPWHRTSDRAELGPGGLTPLGRADLLVKVLGELVDPEAIEKQLLEMAGGILPAGCVAVAAVPDGRAGHLLVPVFESRVPAGVMLDMLSIHSRAVPGYMRLAPPLVMEKLPRGGLGKLLRGEIASFCRGRLGR